MSYHNRCRLKDVALYVRKRYIVRTLSKNPHPVRRVDFPFARPIPCSFLHRDDDDLKKADNSARKTGPKCIHFKIFYPTFLAVHIRKRIP